jgi:hypothetical protein
MALPLGNFLHSVISTALGLDTALRALFPNAFSLYSITVGEFQKISKIIITLKNYSEKFSKLTVTNILLYSNK